MKALLIPGSLVLMSALFACTTSAGGGGTGGNSGIPCTETTPGLCPPTSCTDGVQRTGGASCQDGYWVCEEVACDAGTGGCDGATIEAASYDQSCTADTDCTAVYQGSLCGECFCPSAAINESALATYDSDFAAGGKHVNVCDCTSTAPPVCQGGVCVLPGH